MVLLLSKTSFSSERSCCTWNWVDKLKGSASGRFISLTNAKQFLRRKIIFSFRSIKIFSSRSLKIVAISRPNSTSNNTSAVRTEAYSLLDGSVRVHAASLCRKPGSVPTHFHEQQMLLHKILQMKVASSLGND